jgi:hypothetical protein
LFLTKKSNDVNKLKEVTTVHFNDRTSKDERASQVYFVPM